MRENLQKIIELKYDTDNVIANIKANKVRVAESKKSSKNRIIT